MTEKNAMPNWQPIGQVSRIAHHIDGMLESAEEQYESLQLARPKPHVLDDFVNAILIESHSLSEK